MQRKPKSSSKNKEKNKMSKLILLNDNYNTFDHVIDCLEIICDHDILQAEQCAIFTHYKGSCIVKTGLLEELESYQKDLCLYGLNVKIE